MTERVRKKRLEQAQSVARVWRSRSRTRLIIVGDFNAYQFTDGYVGRHRSDHRYVTIASRAVVSGTEPGRSEPDQPDRTLCPKRSATPTSSSSMRNCSDHALVNQAMVGSVVGITYARGNRTLAARGTTLSDSALFASDHDGFVVFLSAPGRPAPGSEVVQTVREAAVNRRRPRPRRREPGRSQPAWFATASTSRTRARHRSQRRRHEFFSGAAVSVAATTSGCDEDPDGVPAAVGGHRGRRLGSFTIDVDTGGA